MALAPYENFVLENKMTDIVNTTLDMRSLFNVDTTLAQSAGMQKVIHKYTYNGVVEKLAKGAKNTSKGTASYSTVKYDVARYQQTFVYNDVDLMTDPFLVDTMVQGASVAMANEIKTEYFAELAKIANTATCANDKIYEGVVDAIASLDKSGDLDIEGLFIIMGADARAAVRKDVLFEAVKQGDIVISGQFGTIAGIPCVFSNLVPANTVYVTEQKAITFFVKSEGSVEQDRDIESKDNTVVYERHGVIALTDDTRSCILSLTAGE
jgi:hypothetical protein